MADTAIEWTDKVWNATTGCDRVSPGCDNCYALTLAARLKRMGQAKYQTDGDPRTSGPGFGLAVHDDTLDAPFGWRKPRRVFVNSMSDLFHDDVPDEFIARVFAVMALTPEHTYQILTKRPGRMASLLTSSRWLVLCPAALGWVLDNVSGPAPHYDAAYAWATAAERFDDVLPPLTNVWIGVSVEDQKWADVRIPQLLRTPAAVRFLSCEPLLGPIDIEAAFPADYEASRAVPDMPLARYWIDWVIAGGESGPGARPMRPGWARSLRDQCQAADVPFFFKQWGGRTPKAGGRELDGRTWDEFPDASGTASA